MEKELYITNQKAVVEAIKRRYNSCSEKIMSELSFLYSEIISEEPELGKPITEIITSLKSIEPDLEEFLELHFDYSKGIETDKSKTDYLLDLKDRILSEYNEELMIKIQSNYLELPILNPFKKFICYLLGQKKEHDEAVQTSFALSIEKMIYERSEKRFEQKRRMNELYERILPLNDFFKKDFAEIIDSAYDTNSLNRLAKKITCKK